MSEPIVSVIMPAHNRAASIGKSIESVLSQTFEDFELIVINDGSADNTSEVVHNYNDPRIKCIDLFKNGQICNALNVGIEESQGRFIARIDDDDIWHSDKLKKQVDFLCENEEYGACFTWVNVVDSYGNHDDDSPIQKLFDERNRIRRDWVRRFFVNANSLCHPSAVFSRKVIQDVGKYNISLLQLQDFDLWIRIVKKYPIYIITERLVDYRWDDSANLSSHSAEAETRTHREFKYVMSRYLDDISDEEFIKVFSADFYNKSARSHDQLMCERALLLLEKSFMEGYYTKESGLYSLFELINRQDTRDILAYEYNLSQLDIYKLSGGGEISFTKSI